MTVSFTVNSKAATSDAPPHTPLLWVIREQLKLTGTKFGCGTYPRIVRAVERAAREG